MISRLLPLVLCLSLCPPLDAGAQQIDDSAWQDTVDAARGQTVRFNAWGGSEPINEHIAWVGEQVGTRYGIELEHIKLDDTAIAVGRVLAEKTAGRDARGSVDLIWINGENFISMKENDLLYGPFAFDLPNFALVDTEGKPVTVVDFTVPTEGYESPWGAAQFVIVYDSATVPEPPMSFTSLAAWAKANPGRFTYPAPPNFIGSTFLKNALYAFIDDPARLQDPAPEGEAFLAVSAGLWTWLDDITPHLWRSGVTYPPSGPAQHRLLDDGEVDFSFANNPAEASTLIEDRQLPETVRTLVPEIGSIANAHFVAIPYNSPNKAAAQVVANFLLSPEAQLKKQDPAGWGDFTVLAMGKLDAEQRAAFETLPRGPATLPPQELTPTLLEPHTSWLERIEQVWRERYAG